MAAIRAGLASLNIPEDAVQLLDDPSRETAREFMRLNEYLNVLIPRGGAGLIRSVLENSTVPVIETGTGNCHIYVDESADLNMALEILFNAKTQRIGVCKRLRVPAGPIGAWRRNSFRCEKSVWMKSR